MKRALFVCLAAALLVTAAQGAQWQSLSDNFDSYADQAAFQAAWPSWDTGNTTLGLFQFYGYPSTAPGVDGQCLSVGALGSMTTNTRMNYRLLPQIATPNDANPVVFEYKLYDPGTGSGNTARQFCQIRGYKQGGVEQANPWMPATNSATDMYSCIQYGTYSPTNTGKFCYRFAAASGVEGKLDGTANAYAAMPTWTAGTIARKTTGSWRTMKVVVAGTYTAFYVDGVLDVKYLTRNSATHTGAAPWTPFDGAILGSGLATNTAALYDDVLVTPEPMTLALLGFGSLLLRRRRAA